MHDEKRQRKGQERDWITPGSEAEPKRPAKPKADPSRTRNEDPKEGDKGVEAGRDKNKEENDKGSRGKGDKEDEAPKPLPWWPFVLAAVIVAVFVGVVLWIVFRPRPDVWTDDAYVRVYYATIAPRISGQIATVAANDNEAVKAGQILATLDPRDSQTAVASAQAQLERDLAQSGDAEANVQRQPYVIEEQQSQVDSAKARLAFSEADAQRYTNLAASGAGTTQQRQQADMTLQQNRASLRSAGAQLGASEKQLEVLRKQKTSADAAVLSDRAQLEKAQLNLSYTQVLAPLDGMVAERSVQVGNIVAAGSTLMTVVPLDRVYVEANYREVDLLHVRAGQRVTIHVDSYNIDLEGTVNGVPAASGATFAPIAPNNATGNFTKIVQRLPVKIDINPDQPLADLLRVGFSVETTIHTGLEDVVVEQRGPGNRVIGR